MNLQSLRDFLESEGGQLAVAIFMVMWLGTIAFIMHETGHDPKQTGVVLLSNAFTALMSVIIVKLTNKKS